MTKARFQIIGCFTLLGLLLIFPYGFELFHGLVNIPAHVYQRESLLWLVFQHIWMVGAALGLSSFLGIGIGVCVTRPWGRAFLPLTQTMATLFQTFPPIAVLALAVPVVGYGPWATLITLFLYGLLPIVSGTISGLETVSPSVKEISSAVGMGSLQTLWFVEFPLASPVIMAGVRLSAMISVGTATIGAIVGAKNLGFPIIAGLDNGIYDFTIEGTVLVGLLALFVDSVLKFIQARVLTVDS